MRDKLKIVDIEASLVHETDAARLFDVGNDDNVWIPKSQHEWDPRDGVISLPENVALEKGLI